METAEEKRATFTPGPWEIQDAGPGTIRGLRFRVVTKDSIIARTTDGWKEARANARLIAAAPAMYEVLQELADSMELAKNYGYEKEHAMIQEVLAKVEGGEG
jgi:hypothetical protein